MTENVSYKKCTCDICGKVENISQSAVLPKEWEGFTIGRKSYDVCLECFVKVDMMIEDLKMRNEYGTNADYIRDMNNEDLCEFLVSKWFIDDVCKNCEGEYDKCGEIEFCKTKILEWLEQIRN